MISRSSEPPVWTALALALAALVAVPVADVLAAPGAATAAVSSALDRPAVAVQAPQRAVLLAAARAGTRTLAVGERGIIALSDDDGRSWRQASVPTSVTLTALRFADAQRGWAVGHGGTVLATEDGGQRWVRQLEGRGGDAQLMMGFEPFLPLPENLHAEALRRLGDVENLKEMANDGLLVENAQKMRRGGGDAEGAGLLEQGQQLLGDDEFQLFFAGQEELMNILDHQDDVA